MVQRVVSNWSPFHASSLDWRKPGKHETGLFSSGDGETLFLANSRASLPLLADPSYSSDLPGDVGGATSLSGIFMKNSVSVQHQSKHDLALTFTGKLSSSRVWSLPFTNGERRNGSLAIPVNEATSAPVDAQIPGASRYSHHRGKSRKRWGLRTN